MLQFAETHLVCSPNCSVKISKAANLYIPGDNTKHLPVLFQFCQSQPQNRINRDSAKFKLYPSKYARQLLLLYLSVSVWFGNFVRSSNPHYRHYVKEYVGLFAYEGSSINLKPS